MLAQNNKQLDAKNKSWPAEICRHAHRVIQRKARLQVMEENIAAKIREYRGNAKRYRELAAEVDGFEKKQLENMAEEWERRAIEAETCLRNTSGRS